MAKGKFTITEKDYIKAVRKADREREIEMYGKVISIKFYKNLLDILPTS